MTSVQWILCVLHLLLLSCKDAFGGLNVILSIEPSVVELNHTAILRCLYDTGNDPLYMVKWYRGAHEFYRYLPNQHPETKIFHYPGIHIDLHSSNSTQVTLRYLDFRMSGNFTCEVTTDGAPVSTGHDTRRLLVVQLPHSSPTISVGRDPLDYGDILKANCTSPPSRPPAFLKFSLNNITEQVARTESPQQIPAEPAWSDLMLELQLSEYHFHGGRLRLSCTAQVANVYSKEAVLELESARHPVPERVHAESSSTCTISSHSVINLMLYMLFFLNSS